MLLALWWLCTEIAHAGGPWVQTQGQLSVYLGTEAQRIERLVPGGGSFDTESEPIDVDEGISSFFFKSFFTYGLTPRSEVEIQLPYGVVRTNRSDGAVCATFGGDTCETTRGLAPITARAKVNWLDQTYGAPFSGAVGLEFRHGEHTADTRQRLTNLGEGTFDAGLVVSAGRVGGLTDGGYYYTYADFTARYRTANRVLSERRIPGSELLFTADAVAVPNGQLGFGPTINGIYRPAGVDFGEGNLADVDRFTELRIANLQVGGKLTLGLPGGSTASLSATRTFYAENNPIQNAIGFGLSLPDVLPRRAPPNDAASEE